MEQGTVVVEVINEDFSFDQGTPVIVKELHINNSNIKIVPYHEQKEKESNSNSKEQNRSEKYIN